MMTCDGIRTQLAEHAVGGGSRRQRARITRHLSGCASCRKELAALERTGTLLSALPVESAPAGSWNVIRAQLAARAADPPPARASVAWLVRVRWRLALVTVVLLAIGVGLLGLSPRRHAAPPVVIPIAKADPEMQATLEGHLSAARFAPLSDDAAIGLDLESSDSNS